MQVSSSNIQFNVSEYSNLKTIININPSTVHTLLDQKLLWVVVCFALIKWLEFPTRGNDMRSTS